VEISVKGKRPSTYMYLMGILTFGRDDPRCEDRHINKVPVGILRVVIVR